MGIYEELGVRRVINADARLTRLGGSRMPEPVLAAMREAAASYVDMFELQAKVGLRLAELTHNQAAFVAGGAAAGLTLSALACMAGADLGAIALLPEIGTLKHEIIIHAAQRIPYDLALRLAGAHLITIGNVLQTFPWELEAALSHRTAAVVYIAGDHLSRGALTLEETVVIAHAHGVPVIVDAAAQLPPATNLWRFTRDQGADLAIFSGGKDLAGPQASGLIVGRSELIAACAAHASPHQRLCRPMKVGKEEMVGLLAAVELYLQQDHTARVAGFEQVVAAWVAALNQLPGITAWRDFPNEAGQPTPRALISLDAEQRGLTGAQLRQALWEGEPAVAVAQAGPNAISITPDTLAPGEEQLVLEQIVRMLGAHLVAG